MRKPVSLWRTELISSSVRGCPLSKTSTFPSRAIWTAVETAFFASTNSTVRVMLRAVDVLPCCGYCAGCRSRQDEKCRDPEQLPRLSRQLHHPQPLPQRASVRPTSHVDAAQRNC